MKKLKIAGLLILLLQNSLLVHSQDPQSSTPVYTSSTDYVEVPVTVQRGGKHVTGLKKESFSLRQDGKEQPIVSFQEVHRTDATDARAPQSTEDVPQKAPEPIIIIALDLVNTPNLDRAYFADELQRYLLSARRFGGPLGLVAIERSGIRVIKDFTTDPQQLLAAFRKEINKAPTANNDIMKATREISEQALSETESQLQTNGAPLVSPAAALHLRSMDENMVRFQDRSSRIDSQMVIQQLAQALKGLPGRKSVLLVGSGFKFIDSNIVLRMIGGQGEGGPELRYSVENGGQTMDLTAYTWKVLNDANVVVYPIDTRRTVNTAYQSMDVTNVNTPSGLTHEQNRQADRDVLDTFKTIAAATGGKPCFYRTDLDNCVREAVDDDADYYLLGFYADKNNRKPGWHKIEVKLGEKANVRHRQGFMIASFNPEQQRKTDIGLALSSPFAYTTLSFSAEFEPFGDGKGAKVARFHLIVPAGTITPTENGQVDFDVIAVARADGGKDAGHFNQRVNRKFPPEAIAEINRIGIDYKNSLELPSGDYAVWFVLRDNVSGRTGSSVVKLNVP
jgi:VWFA-related protein